MSNAWKNGSSPQWRRIRAAVLERDNWTCQLCGEPIPPGLHRTHPRSAQVHHTRPRHLVGDDPQHLQAAHRACNLSAGEPGRGDPAPSPGGWW